MIKVGRYKNWREVCKAMGWKTTGGTYKEARKKDLNTVIKIIIQVHAIIIILKKSSFIKIEKKLSN